MNLKIIKLYIDRLDIAIPCGYLSVSLIQICNQTAGQSVIIQPQLKDSQTSVLCPKMYKCSQETNNTKDKGISVYHTHIFENSIFIV